MAERKVTVNNPGMMKGVEVEVPGVGRVKNGESVTADLTDEVAEGLSETFGVEVSGVTKKVPSASQAKAEEGKEVS